LIASCPLLLQAALAELNGLLLSLAIPAVLNSLLLHCAVPHSLHQRSGLPHLLKLQAMLHGLHLREVS
jgi:hypothetical protein